MNEDREWEALLDRHLNDEATPADIGALNRRLRSDAAARAEFVEMLNLDSALAGLAAATPARIQARPKRQAALLPTLGAIAAVLALLVAGSWWWQQQQVPLATVAKSIGTALAEGAAVDGQRQELAAGAIELVTQRGVRLVIEAPAEFQFESPQRLHLFRGRAAADVPPGGKGFTIVTANGEAVDLGTKFGVDATTPGTAEIHVFQGEVIAKPKGSGRQSLRDGEAMTLQSGGGSARDLRSAAFIRPDEVASLSAGLIAGQKARAEAALEHLRREPALIALLDFENQSPLLEGTFRMVQGRWPGSQAPEFLHVGDHMKLSAGDDRSWPQLTLAAWVRLDRLGEPYHSLYHTDGWQEDRPGQVHWMLNRDTTMRLALRQNVLAESSQEREGYPDSLTPVLPERGRWIHLATVYDADARTVRFYLNGSFDKEAKLSTAHRARLGPAQIGNWDQRDRRLSGRLDELLLLGRAMTDGEIQALHAAGNPYR